MNNTYTILSQIDNLLPYDGEVYYYQSAIEHPQILYETLAKEIRWQSDKIRMFGKEIMTKRKVAWYGDENLKYTYSGATKIALPWTTTLLTVKNRIELLTNNRFNSCLLNLYHSGEEGMGWHSDNEKDLQRHGCIVSISLGASRKFVFKHKIDKKKIEILLENGSLLIMKGTIQENWLHSLPTTKKIHTPRINLTFRNIIRYNFKKF